MDADRFDTLIRALVSRRSRRHLVATAAALLGGRLARVPFDGAADALANNKNKKGKGKKKKKKPAPCRPGDCCTNNEPGCPAGQKCCGGNCIDKGFCCEDGAAKVPDCGETCCGPEEECCEGECHNPLLIPLTCNSCQEIECVSGEGYACVQRRPGVACGDDCCSGGQEYCCGEECCPQGQEYCCGEECCPTEERCCGEKCCPEGQECCGNTNCYDPETQCCGFSSLVGSPCDEVGCCVSAAPYHQSCCTTPGFAFKRCWGRLSPCAECEYPCGATCCKTDQECCFAESDGSKPDRCIPLDRSCDE